MAAMAAMPLPYECVNGSACEVKSCVTFFLRRARLWFSRTEAPCDRYDTSPAMADYGVESNLLL